MYDGWVAAATQDAADGSNGEVGLCSYQEHGHMTCMGDSFSASTACESSLVDIEIMGHGVKNRVRGWLAVLSVLDCVGNGPFDEVDVDSAAG